MLAYKSLKTKQKSTALTTIWPYKTNPKLFSQDSCILAFFECVFIDLNFFSVLKMQNRKKLMNLANISHLDFVLISSLMVVERKQCICHSQTAMCGGSICCTLSVTYSFFMLTGVLRCGTLFTHLWMTLRQCSWYEKIK